MSMFELWALEALEALADEEIFLGFSMPFYTMKSLEAPTACLLTLD